MGMVRSTLAAALLCALAHDGAIAQDGTSPEQRTPPEDSRAGESSRRHPVERVRPPAGHQKRARADRRQLQLKGKVSEVWQAPVDESGRSAETVVLVETERGQTMAAILGPAERLQGVGLEEGTPVMVAGALVSLGQERYFVPGRVQIGERPMDLQREPVRLTRPKQRQIRGKIVEARRMGAEASDAPETQMVVIEVTPQERVLVDMGPADQLAELPLTAGQTVEVKGVETGSRERALIMAQQVRAGEAEAQIQRQGASTQTEQRTQEETPAR